MAIDLENKEQFQNSQELLKQFSNMNPKASDEEVKEKYTEYMNAYSEDLANAIRKDMQKEQGDNSVLNSRNVNRLTNEEKKFYNALVSEDHVNTDTNWKDGELLPETVVDRIFEDIESEHPLLNHINIQRTGLKTRVIRSVPEGQVVWGKIFGEIRGQLEATFFEQDVTLGKATAFVVVPKDLKDAGVQWVDRYVRLQIKEAFAVAIEKTAIQGLGKAQDQPVGLMKEINRSNGAVSDKAVAGTLTLKDPDTSIREIGDVIKNLSTKEFYDKDGNVKTSKGANVLNNVVIALNPADYIYTGVAFMQLHNGSYVSPIPFNMTFEQSEFVPQGKAVAFDKTRYNFYAGSEVIVREFDQTLALEDMDLYTAKQFLYAEPDDNKTSFVYDVDFSTLGAPKATDASPQA
ncbi:phage major capsid protein [Staphylococcus kloosii]|uniref:Major capsid protein n=1 Tax=Staphylococcus kloosii TaxID=29384 RepID=A0ABQ0XNS8_9STAP|nr:phage major capsid protein [Staphylococcus kloosii]AVQ35794.1 phage major capsid protein [Staphylococcus kloosii]PNZ05432.1 phage major capsid protein [Staphylococcus kloosii]GEP82558.1 major capsid protein [Staphylococcus kloosii]SUM48861.1 phage protein [Staphylococcus kloosii]